jgi:hypothetical protein
MLKFEIRNKFEVPKSKLIKTLDQADLQKPLRPTPKAPLFQYPQENQTGWFSCCTLQNSFGFAADFDDYVL